MKLFVKGLMLLALVLCPVLGCSSEDAEEADTTAEPMPERPSVEAFGVDPSQAPSLKDLGQAMREGNLAGAESGAAAE